MARFHRKDLKRDRFVEEVTHQVEFFSGHRRQVVAGGSAVLVLLVCGLGYRSYSSQRNASSLAALHDAIDLYHGVVSAEEQPGLKTFATEADRLDQITRALDAVILDYPGTSAASGAMYYSGLLDRAEGNMNEARAHFEQAIRGKAAEYPALARMALGALLVEQGEAEAAREQYQAVVDAPTTVVSKEQASIELARTFVSSDPGKAREILDEIQSGNSAASSLAASLLATLDEGS